MANRSNNRQLNALIQRDGVRCHYCDVICVKATDNITANLPNCATREHVVPRSWGGSNKMHNLVLACRKCNNGRGNSRDQYCKCNFCSAAYELTWDDQFEVIIETNYNKIWKDIHSGRWKVRWEGDRRSFKTWQQAMDYVNTRIRGYAWTSNS